MKKIFLLAPMLILASCASMQTAHIDDDGKHVYKLTCSEFNSSLDECQQNAEKLCSNGYKLQDYYRHVYADPGDGFYMPDRHHLTVKCI